ncbi:FAD:protein FMN transferase [Flavobacterium sp. MXW15]|uniref:FAD:protein FMN transferase n=1 Tax=Xanthomonas chitinilytica TaxID=2989819 RepID=A0ABT3JUP8_9XANT|nr:FAD:protein FMN transferase [Xanthomonas sp. H13-6]MCW4453461.1 FAD:protein FMN transferase [Flavobacterium sp. MXW15]MCW4472186.1 FAD:protein FMN transferase [Xanthomonas sp. H13-6]
MQDASLDIATLGGHTMGTRWSVKLATRRARDLHPLHAGIQAQLDRVVAQMSNWEPDSDISRYNRGDAGSWHALPEEFFRVLETALDIARRSGGAFDPSIGPLVALWGFGAGAQAPRVPDAATLAATARHCGWQRLQLRASGREALQPGALRLDLSAIAKGFGVDQVGRWLRGIGIAAALVEVGGELHGYGRKPDGQPWRVLVESGPDEDAAGDWPPRVLALDDLAVATSGDRWHRHEIDGRRYSHTLDPRTAAPVPHAAAAVTVVARAAMDADAWATALTVMGADEGMAFARAHGIAARFVSRGAEGVEEAISPAFQQHLDASAA